MKLYLSGKGLTTLQGIDLSRVTELYCFNNQLTSLPPLPPTLRMLGCSNNQLTSLPELPPNLRRLYCKDNKLTVLPVLKHCIQLEALNCSKNKLTCLPDIPSTLKILHCSKNKLTSLPELKHCYQLAELYCRDNQLTCIPTLPATLKELSCTMNDFTHYWLASNALPDLPYTLYLLCANGNLGFLDVDTVKLIQHNEKRKKLGLEIIKTLPQKEVWDDINERYTTSRYEPGGDMFEQSLNTIEKLLKSKN